MKARHLLCLVSTFLLASPYLANAEIYKWKDKDGTVRYSDTPPPSNIKPEAIGAKKPVQSTVSAPSPATAEAKPADAANVPKLKDPPEDPAAAAAKLRQRNAEIEKKNKQEKEAQAKLKEENCKAAKANHESYAQGGRVYKMNERGEREYMSDKELKEGAEKTQNEINEYCN